MLIFHEGLPRSGKSYEAMVEHVLPALIKERKVFAYVEGLDHEKIAELIEKPVERVRELLIQLTREDVPVIYSKVEKNSLVLIDELQNFFPNGRAKLPEEMMRFIAEHGHDGIDIVMMGQNFKDCHSAWRRRTERKVLFIKLSAIGQDNRYKWTTYQAIPTADRDPMYEKVSGGVKKYDPKYFGIYKSHTSDDVNTEHYKDGRFNIFQKKSLVWGVPLFLFAAAFAGYYVYSQFKNPDEMVNTSKPKETKSVSFVQTPSPQSPQSAPSPSPQSVAKAGPSPDVIKLKNEVKKLTEQNKKLEDVIQKYKDDPNMQFKERSQGYPETAPAFDHLRQVNTMPVNIGCIADDKTCACYTSQGTRIPSVPYPRCVSMAHGDVQFNPYAAGTLASRAVTANIKETLIQQQPVINN